MRPARAVLGYSQTTLFIFHCTRFDQGTDGFNALLSGQSSFGSGKGLKPVRAWLRRCSDPQRDAACDQLIKNSSGHRPYPSNCSGLMCGGFKNDPGLSFRLIDLPLSITLNNFSDPKIQYLYKISRPPTCSRWMALNTVDHARFMGFEDRFANLFKEGYSV